MDWAFLKMAGSAWPLACTMEVTKASSTSASCTNERCRNACSASSSSSRCSIAPTDADNGRRSKQIDRGKRKMENGSMEVTAAATLKCCDRRKKARKSFEAASSSWEGWNNWVIHSNQPYAKPRFSLRFPVTSYY